MIVSLRWGFDWSPSDLPFRVSEAVHEFRRFLFPGLWLKLCCAVKRKTSDCYYHLCMVAELRFQHRSPALFPNRSATMSQQPAGSNPDVQQPAGASPDLPTAVEVIGGQAAGSSERPAKRYASSSTPLPRDGDESRHRRTRSTTPKRSSSMLSPPPPLDQETPLSDSVNDMPVNDSTVDDIRFWAIKKFSEMNRKIVNLTQRSNHHLERASRTSGTSSRPGRAMKM